MTTSPISFTSTDFTSVLNDINADSTLKDKPEWFKRIWAGVRDVLGVQINATANQSFLRTAFTRQAVADLCELIDYQIATYTTASGNLLFHLNADSITFPKSLTIADLSATVASGSKRFEARAAITERATSATFSASIATNKLTIAGETFTNSASTDLLVVARIYNTGEKVQVSSTTTLPSPLAAATNYYAIYSDATHIYLAETYSNAMAGTYINLTDTGTGTHTVNRIYTTGEKVRLTTTTTLPSPFATGTDYYVIYSTATTIYLADSCIHAFSATAIDVLSTGTGTHTIHMYTAIATCYQQTSLDAAVSIGTSDGTTEWQVFYLPDSYALDAAIAIVVNSVTWTAVTNFAESVAADTHYKILNLTDGMKAIMFSDGVYGAIPGNFDIMADYAVGGGANSNVTALNSITTYSGGDIDILTTTNAVAFSGGADEESLAHAKAAAPMLLKARNRDITIDDSIYLAENYAGVLKAGCNPNYYGLFSQQIVVVPEGGGVASSDLLTDLETYLTALTIMESVTTVAITATYVPVSITMTVKISPTATWATVQGYVVQALQLMFSEVGQEVLNSYDSGGIASAVTYINTHWTKAFTADDYNALTAIIDNLTIADFGMSWQRSDIEGFIDSFVEGVDYCVLATATPITTAVYEIAQDNINPALITEIP